MPTPTDKNKKPFLKPLIEASKSVGKVLSKGNIVIYESTVYPGVTEEICAPILEKESKLVYNKDFFLAIPPKELTQGTRKQSQKY